MLSVIEGEFGYGKFHPDDKSDMVHCMRYVGYHLGILDDFNICESVEALDEYL